MFLLEILPRFAQLDTWGRKNWGHIFFLSAKEEGLVRPTRHLQSCHLNISKKSENVNKAKPKNELKKTSLFSCDLCNDISILFLLFQCLYFHINFRDLLIFKPRSSWHAKTQFSLFEEALAINLIFPADIRKCFWSFFRRKFNSCQKYLNMDIF